MRRRGLGFSAALVLAGALAACRSVAPGGRGDLLPPDLPTGAAVVSDEEIRLARDLYVAKCAKCHRFYHPADYPEAEWTSWMKKMSRKSKLKPDEEELLSRYLVAFRLVAPTDKAGSPQ